MIDQERPAAPVCVSIERLPDADDLPLPTYATLDAAGADCAAALVEPLSLAPGERALVPLGFAIALPRGYEAQIRPRSGLALRQGVTVLNSPGTIDADYRGPLAVILINLGTEPVTITRGDRIAQLVVAPVVRAQLHPVDVLDTTARGNGGFGSTGLGNLPISGAV